ncbi:tannase/feruloyl esterase family alpha/beta hydrolase [Porticoccaceae bacterium]|nr:tannase/feruloyl esterase family alpha/beta hydrolase [Porticoccaceae bacterium]
MNLLNKLSQGLYLTTRGVMSPCKPIFQTAHKHSDSYFLLIVVMLTLMITAPDIQADSKNADAKCEALISSVLAFSKVIKAEVIKGNITQAIPRINSQKVDEIPAFCRVVVHTSFSTDSSVNSEVWLPLSNWNGRFLGVGNGGFAGVIRYHGMLSGIQRGFVVANTDMGTRPLKNGVFPAIAHPIKWLDYGRRSTHGMTVIGKALTQEFYSRGPDYSYWQGCSTGGFQGQRNAQYFPDDYDGIIAGNPGNRRANKVMGLLYNFMQPKFHPKGIISDQKLMLMHKAVLKQCAGLSGGLADDPFLANPYACDWKPETLLCKSSDKSKCLTQAQVVMANKLYSPFVLKSSGKMVWPGLPRGTELGWKVYMDHANQPEPPHADAVRSILGSEHNFSTSDWDHDVETYLQIQGFFWGDADNTDLSAFQKRGGKILSYFGWNDTSTSYDTTNYYQALERHLQTQYNLNVNQAAVKLREFYRLFMMPGVEHCGAGNGPNTIDALTPLMLWVEEGVAPERIHASWTETPGHFPASLGRPLSRPLCPYPLVANYNGFGDKTKAESFSCK